MTELKSKFFSIFLLGLLIANADAITVSEAKLASPLIEAAFPEASCIEKQKHLMKKHCQSMSFIKAIQSLGMPLKHKIYFLSLLTLANQSIC